MKTFIGSCIAVLAVFLPVDLFACEFVISADVTVIDGDELEVQPGDTICLSSGTREHLELVDLTGTPDAPVVVKTHVGEVFGLGTTIAPEGRDEAVLIHRSRDLRLTGFRPVADDPDGRIGLSINAPTTSAGIRLFDVAGNIELDNILFVEVAEHPVVAHARPLCTNDTDEEPNGLTIRRLEAGFLPGTSESGNGIVIGDTEWAPLAEVCAGRPIERYSFFEEVEIRDTWLKTAGDSLRIRGATERCLIRDNRFESARQGAVLDLGSGCEITRSIFDSQSPALQLLEAGPSFVYNNYFSGGGIVVESDGSNEEPHRIVFNTFSPTLRMLTARGSTTQAHRFVNNLADVPSDATSVDDAIQGDLDSWEVHHNAAVFDFSDISSIPYTERRVPARIPYGDSELARAGVSIDEVALDFFGNERPDPPTIGAAEAMGRSPDDDFCIDYCDGDYDPNRQPEPHDDQDDEPRDPDETDPFLEEGPRARDNSSSLDEGCGCASQGTDATPLVLLLFMPGLLWYRKRSNGDARGRV